MTKEQVKAQQKDVTRRFGWWFLRPGHDLWAVEKGMGLQKGEKIERICLIHVVSTRPEPLCAITKDECIREGFPEMEPADFVAMLCRHYRCNPEKNVNRIEFIYL